MKPDDCSHREYPPKQSLLERGPDGYLLVPARMKLLFYSSSLHIGGGGERYFLATAESALQAGLGEIELRSPRAPDAESWQRLGLGLRPKDLAWREADDRTVALSTPRADLLVCMSFGLPISFARRSIMLVQFPSRVLVGQPDASPAMGLRRELKRAMQRRVLSRYSLVCYSEFVRDHIILNYGRYDAQVVYPPSAIGEPFTEKAREILAVGRFTPHKRHDTLIRAFSHLVTNFPEARAWRLNLAGLAPAVATEKHYLNGLRREAAGLPITFYVDVSRTGLEELYSRSSIFWHAAGYQSDRDPAHQEHFGMTTVEAMSFGAVPVVIARGGQPEIVTTGSGLLWSHEDELVHATALLMRDDSGRRRFAEEAIRRSAYFGPDRFRQEMRRVLIGGNSRLEPLNESC